MGHLLPPRRKSLAKSAREATQANEALDAANRKRGCLPKEVRTVSIEEAVMGFGEEVGDHLTQPTLEPEVMFFGQHVLAFPPKGQQTVFVSLTLASRADGGANGPIRGGKKTNCS